MLKSKIGSSIKKCAKEAGAQAASAVKNGLTDTKIAFAYGSCDYDMAQLLAGIAEELPDVPIIGNTSFTGVITPEGFISGQDGFVGIMGLANPALTVGVAQMPKGHCARMDGKTVAKKAMVAAGKDTAPDYFYMVASPGEEEYYLKGITEIIGRVPFFGGSAADNTISGNWKIFTNEGAFEDGVAVAFFYGGKPITNLYTGAYEDTADMGIITALDGDRGLLEIDGKPALKQYAAWRNLPADDLLGGNLLAASITSPLGVKDRLGDLIAIRHPMNGNENYSMNIGNNLAVGTVVIRMEASVDQLIASVKDTITALINKTYVPIGALHLVHCGGRRAGIDNRIEEVVQGVKEAAGDIPFIVEFTFGEYGYEDDGNNTCGGLMLSFTAFPA
ncbi:MAG: FIST N-terminal domain-containing protein [Clostridiales bacterium]